MKLLRNAGIVMGRIFAGTGIARFPVLIALWEFFCTRIACYTRRQVHVHGLHLWVDPVDMGCGIGLLMHGEKFDQFMIRLLDVVLKPGMNVVDIGANIGFVSLLASQRVGPSGHVFAFEPDAANIEFLEQNIRENAAAAISVERKAIADTTGVVHLYQYPQRRAGGARGRIFEAEKGWKPTAVDAVSLDDYFAQRTMPLHLVKIDVEGAEGIVFRGMQETLRKNPQLMLIMEFVPKLLLLAGTDSTTFLDALRAQKYSLYEMEHHGARFLADNAAVLSVCSRRGGGINLLCTRELPESLRLPA